MAQYRGINHLAMVTRDMRVTIRFWRDLLGMRLIAGLGHKGYRHYFFEISESDMIAFFEWPHAEPIEEKDHGVPVKGPVAFDHVSIAVATDDDLWDLKDRLETAGFWVSEVIDHGFIRSIYSFDPNNIPIEFSAPVAAIDLRRHPQMKDRTPLDEALEGAQAREDYWPRPDSPTPPEDRIVYPGEGAVFRDAASESASTRKPNKR